MQAILSISPGTALILRITGEPNLLTQLFRNTVSNPQHNFFQFKENTTIIPKSLNEVTLAEGIQSATQVVWDPEIKQIHDAYCTHDWTRFFSLIGGLVARNETDKIASISSLYNSKVLKFFLVEQALYYRNNTILSIVVGSLTPEEKQEIYTKPVLTAVIKSSGREQHVMATLPLAATAQNEAPMLRTVLEHCPLDCKGSGAYATSDGTGLMSIAATFLNQETAELLAKAADDQDKLFLPSFEHPSFSITNTPLFIALEQVNKAYRTLAHAPTSTILLQNAQKASSFLRWCLESICVGCHKRFVIALLQANLPPCQLVQLLNSLHTTNGSILKDNAAKIVLEIVLKDNAKLILQGLFEYSALKNCLLLDNNLYRSILQLVCINDKPELVKIFYEAVPYVNRDFMFDADKTTSQSPEELAIEISVRCLKSLQKVRPLSNTVFETKKGFLPNYFFVYAATKNFQDYLELFKLCPPILRKKFLLAKDATGASILHAATLNPSSAYLIVKHILENTTANEHSELFQPNSKGLNAFYTASKAGIEVVEALFAQLIFVKKADQIIEKTFTFNGRHTVWHFIAKLAKDPQVVSSYVAHCPKRLLPMFHTRNGYGLTPVALAANNSRVILQEMLKHFPQDQDSSLELAPLYEIPFNTPGKIYAGSLPIDLPNIHERIRAYQQRGVKEIVMLNAHEELPSDITHLAAHYAVHGLKVTQFCFDPEENVNREKFLQITKAIKEKLADGACIVVHGDKENDRTGIFLSVLAQTEFTMTKKETADFLENYLDDYYPSKAHNKCIKQICQPLVNPRPECPIS